MDFLCKLKDTGLKVDSVLQIPRVRVILFALAVIFSFILFLALNVIQPIFFDDWVYAFVYRELDTNERIQNISDIIRSQIHHYYTWGGRSVAHVIAQLLLLIGDPLARVINSIAYVAFIFVIYLHARGTDARKSNASLFILINVLMWFCQVDLSRSILWLTGSANYLWCTLIILLFLLPYRLLCERDSKDSVLKFFCLLIGGIIAGWTNENMAGGMIFMVICILTYLYFNKRTIPMWAYSGLVGAILGFAIMILAPGNYIRSEVIVNGWQVGDISKIDLYMGGLMRVLSGMFFFLIPIFVVFAFSCVLYYFFPSNKSRKNTLFLAFLYLVTALVGTFAMIFSPTFPGRAWFGIITFIIVGVSILYAHVDNSKAYFRFFKYAVFPFLIIAFLGYYLQAYGDMARASVVYAEREKYIEDQKKLGVEDFVFNYDVHPMVSMNYLHDLYNNPENWHNASYARYYGVRSVVIIRPEE